MHKDPVHDLVLCFIRYAGDKADDHRAREIYRRDRFSDHAYALQAAFVYPGKECEQIVLQRVRQMFDAQIVLFAEALHFTVKIQILLRSGDRTRPEFLQLVRQTHHAAEAADRFKAVFHIVGISLRRQIDEREPGGIEIMQKKKPQGVIRVQRGWTRQRLKRFTAQLVCFVRSAKAAQRVVNVRVGIRIQRLPPFLPQFHDMKRIVVQTLFHLAKRLRQMFKQQLGAAFDRLFAFGGKRAGRAGEIRDKRRFEAELFQPVPEQRMRGAAREQLRFDQTVPFFAVRFGGPQEAFGVPSYKGTQRLLRPIGIFGIHRTVRPFVIGIISGFQQAGRRSPCVSLAAH